jgi:serine/threonine protein kinase
MPAPATVDEFLEMVRKSGVVETARLDTHLQPLRAAAALPPSPPATAELLIRDGLLTRFQVEHLLAGKYLGFRLGDYIVLELLGSGGMSAVYLCEHKEERRRVAIKVLPRSLANDQTLLKRFYREARASAALDHPNIVRGFEAGQEKNQHFFVMEYVEGQSLQELVSKNGQMPIQEAASYVCQAALGLQHAFEAGVVHRDIKPGNLLVDRDQTVKILDMGLSRFYNDEDSILTRDVLGTLDYLAPEQARDSHQVDTRADIYSLGGTFYFLLTGQSPLGTESFEQKMAQSWKPPKPIRQFRPDVPETLTAIADKMMDREADRRYPTPMDAATALLPWVTEVVKAKVVAQRKKPSRERIPTQSSKSVQKIKRGLWWAVAGVSLVVAIAAAILVLLVRP